MTDNSSPKPLVCENCDKVGGDTEVRMKNWKIPRILCEGCYEDFMDYLDSPLYENVDD